jgi:hypothetical protein
MKHFVFVKKLLAFVFREFFIVQLGSAIVAVPVVIVIAGMTGWANHGILLLQTINYP